MKTNLKITDIPFICCVTFLGSLMMILSGCEKEGTMETDFTGRSVVYQLISGSEYDISGTATFKERKDGSTTIVIALEGISGDQHHPVHLHYGAVDKEGDLAALLYPLYGSTGESITELKTLANESSITYSELLNFDGSIRVHMDDGPNKNVILSYNNIGKNQLVSDLNAKSFAICK